ncbi:DMT family transporter [Ideonella azotifigens]|uniref:DMT family transporter n=1 Tax=Ideonella azotifigens TaxID=513160 RepID=A0ABP3V0L0_9BURK|nr:DMT family transporter [Ideonella azotifigens]MCD2340971.1 DMT family transporter [Ideonella azotifigens]
MSGAASSSSASLAQPHPLRTGLPLAFAGAIAFSGKAIIVKLAYRHGVDAVTLIMLRMLFALPFFLLLSWWAGRGKPALGLRDWLAILGLGFSGYYLASLLDFMGLAYISASLERLILYLGPTIVLVMSVLLGRQRFTPRAVLAMLVSYAGTLLVFGSEMSLQGTHTVLGGLLVFGSAISYACYLVASGEVVKRVGSLRLTGLASTVACGLCIAHFLVTRPISGLAEVQPAVLWLSVLNATACTVAPVLMTMMAIERLGPTLTAQAGMIGPMSTIFMGIALLGESFTPVLLLGTALVLSGVWIVTRSRTPAAATVAPPGAPAEPTVER